MARAASCWSGCSGVSADVCSSTSESESLPAPLLASRYAPELLRAEAQAVAEDSSRGADPLEDATEAMGWL